jgi:hypothetical protein
MEDVGIFYGQLVNFPAIFMAIAMFWGHLVYFHRFGMLFREKSGNPGTVTQRCATLYFQTDQDGEVSARLS